MSFNKKLIDNLKNTLEGTDFYIHSDMYAFSFLLKNNKTFNHKTDFSVLKVKSFDIELIKELLTMHIARYDEDNTRHHHQMYVELYGLVNTALRTYKIESLGL